MTKPTMGRFNDHPKTTNFAGTPVRDGQRVKSIKGEWGRTMNELGAHQNQGVDVEPIRRAKIADRLKRDHHRAERTRGEARGIIRGRT